jgi:cytochrome bd-type quinol oxidase subunit 2
MDAFRKLTSACLLVGTLLTATPVSAASIVPTIKSGLDAAAPAEYTSSNTNLQSIVAGLIQAALSLVGVLLLIYLIYAGFLWMTAQGDGKQVDKAKDIIKNAVIGLIIIFAAYAIANFVLDRLVSVGGGGATQSGPVQGQPANP